MRMDPVEIYKQNTKNKEIAQRLLAIYDTAWTNRDEKLILTIFTEDAVYNDPTVPMNHGHDGIRNYWVSKVQGEQREINFKLSHVWVDGDEVIAEWHATFFDIKRKFHIDMTEVGVGFCVD